MARKILILDDEEGIRDFLGTFFRDKGYTVYAAEEGSVALAIIEKESPHLMLLDLKMPSMGGMDVFRQAKRLKRDIQVIIITAMDDRRMRRYARRLGVIEYILKPFSLSYLNDLIEAKVCFPA
ncbi:MAG: response regulator [Candidatus Omnitrophica bacterium]|nr:response regulator [Candidatus Omnitrophota bacterium]